MVELPQHDRFATVTPAVAHIVKHDGDGSPVESWEYSSDKVAHMALLSWQARQFEGEPRGWTYHWPSWRYRVGGDPGREMLLTAAARVLALSPGGPDHADSQQDGGTQT